MSETMWSAEIKARISELKGVRVAASIIKSPVVVYIDERIKQLKEELEAKR